MTDAPPFALAELYPVPGIRCATVEAGVRYQNRRDLVLFELAEGTHTAAVFTRNAFCAAPVQLARRHIESDQPRFWLINTGNANAGTGAHGLSQCRHTCNALAQAASVPEWTILPFSTGVIGEALPAERIAAAIPAALQGLKTDGWQDAAWGIMTSDSKPKGVSFQIEVAGTRYTFTGIAKGAGMIRPNMATMLAFVATDMAVEPSLLQAILHEAVEKSFNRITVDGDTSTNDSCVLAATGAAGNALVSERHSELAVALATAVDRVMLDLAQQIVRDGEGATKFITVQVEDGASIEECCEAAYTVAHSPLVKTAFFASDPNWGRILAALGRSGIADLDVNKVEVWLNDVRVCWLGGLDPSYQESMGAEVMKQKDILVRLVLGRGPYLDRVYTCDFSYDYVKINAEYRS